MLDISKITKVYSGKAGKCMCGCAGKYSYNEGTEHEEWQGDVNVRTVKMFTKQIKSNPAVKYGNGYMYFEHNGRIKVAYFKVDA